MVEEPDLPLADDELARLALDATPFDPFDPDVPPLADDTADTALLPGWYMPPPSRRRTRGRTVVLVGVALALLVINVGGFCVTYGFPEFVWK